MPLNETTRILTAISATEPCTFGEFLNGLGDDRPEWRDLFRTLETFEKGELVEIERGPGNKIESLQLTSLGAERAREALKGADRL